MDISTVFFIMIALQAVAYLWFQSQGGVVSHKKFIFINFLLMTGQAAQSMESLTKEAYASFSIATFFFFITGFGVMRRYLIMKREKN